MFMQNNQATTLNSIFLKYSPPTDLIELAKIATVHGVRGWVKVQTYSNQPEALLQSKIWWLQPKGQSNQWHAITVASCNKHGAGVLLTKFADLNDRELAKSLQNYTIWISRADFPATANDEFYWVDLIDCQFFGLEQNKQVLLGKVTEVIENSAHAILNISYGSFTADGSFQAQLDNKNRPVTSLVPFVSAHILEVDLSNKRIISNWPADF